MKTRIILSTLLLSACAVVGLTAQVMPLVYEVENTGADCPPPPLPPFDQLATIQSLPDPFAWSDTTKGRIASRSDWRCRRAEIGAEIERYEMGTKPPPPDSLDANFSAADSILTVTIKENGKTLTLTSKITLPVGNGPFAAVIGVGFTGTGSLPADIFTSRGIATIQFLESQITNAWSNVRGDGPFYEMYPDKSRGKFIAWAWGMSRLIDGLEQCPETKINLSRLAVTGCSYAGKIALFSGAFDERIALTIAIESGGGGYTAWRVTETLSGSRETLRNAQGQQWYLEGVSQFNNAVTKLPYDHHELMAMVAPRALFVTGNPDYEWLADESGHVGSKAAYEVWKALGVPDRFGFSIVGGHSHCALPTNQKPEVENYIEKFLLGNTIPNTKSSTSPYYTDVSPWITWTTPDLSVPSSTGNSGEMIDRFELEQNYPNPFNPTTEIRYQMSEVGKVRLTVYDLLGREVTVLVDDIRDPGTHQVLWDASHVPSGMYFCRLTARGYVDTRKMMLMK